MYTVIKGNYPRTLKEYNVVIERPKNDEPRQLPYIVNNNLKSGK